jgi:predicted transcriptional regulator
MPRNPDTQYLDDCSSGLNVKSVVGERQKNAWLESCEAALKHFDETGSHATHEEVMNWMDSWGSDKELSAPVCHP